jgi:hypothetical protein
MMKVRMSNDKLVTLARGDIVHSHHEGVMLILSITQGPIQYDGAGCIVGNVRALTSVGEILTFEIGSGYHRAIAHYLKK